MDDPASNPNRGKLVVIAIGLMIVGALALKIELQRLRPPGEPMTPPPEPPMSLRRRTGMDPPPAQPDAVPSAQEGPKASLAKSERVLQKCEDVILQIAAAHPETGRLDAKTLVESVQVGEESVTVVLSPDVTEMIRVGPLREQVRVRLENSLHAEGFSSVTIRTVTAAGRVVDLGNAIGDDASPKGKMRVVED